MSKKNKQKRNKSRAAKEQFTWDMLNKSRLEISKDIMKQQLMVSEFIRMNKEAIEKDKDTLLTITGFMKSIADLANEVRITAIQHAESVKTLEDGTEVANTFKTGIVNTANDDYFTFLSLSNSYIATSEKLAHLISIGYIDLFTKLKSEQVVNELSKIKEEGVEATKAAIKDSNEKAERIIKEEESNNE